MVSTRIHCIIVVLHLYRSHKSSGKKSKVKELSYQSVVVKGGGLLRVYSALVNPLEHRLVVVCGKKTTVAEVVATALAKCGKQDLDPKRYELVSL